MTPFSFLCWLTERRWLWLGRRRFQPQPDQNYPVAIAAIMPFVVTALAVVCLLGLGRWVESAIPGASIATFWYLLLAGLAWIGGAVHWGLTLLSWNQRAARLQAQGETTAGARGPRWFVWLPFGAVYLAFIWMVTPVAVVTAVENFRGALAWKEARAELIAQGERLTLRELVADPARIPAADNFFSVPPFDTLLEQRAPPATGTGVSSNALKALQRLHLPPSTYLAPRGKEVPRDVLVPLSQWAQAFRTAISNQALAKHAHGLPEYATPPAGTSDGAYVLAALAPAEPLVHTLCEASRRPQAVFPIAYEDGFNALLPHLAYLKSFNNLLDVRIAAKLSLGDTTGAWSDLECSWRVSQVVATEPLLISQLVRYAQVQIALNSLRRGLAVHAWNDAQLQSLQRELEQPNYFAGMAVAVAGERNGGVETLDRWVANRGKGPDELGLVDSDGNDSGFGGPISLMPSGWLRQNQVTLARSYGPFLDLFRSIATNNATGAPGRQLAALATAQEAAWESTRSRMTPFDIMARMLMPAWKGASFKVLRTVALTRCAIAGCALERYRLKNGRYPETLSALVPEFLASVPLDPIDGQPLRYALEPDGLFRLWSVGENDRDDGGNAEPPDPQKPSTTATQDWVWAPGH